MLKARTILPLRGFVQGIVTPIPMNIFHCERLHLFLFCMLAALTLNDANAQSGKEGCVVLGKVVDQKTNAPLPFASVVLQGEASGTSTDMEGEFRLEGVPPGVHNVLISFLGYNNFVAFEIETTPSRPAVVNAAMSQAAVAMEAAEVAVESRATLAEAPLSVRSIGTN